MIETPERGRRAPLTFEGSRVELKLARPQNSAKRSIVQREVGRLLRANEKHLLGRNVGEGRPLHFVIERADVCSIGDLSKGLLKFGVQTTHFRSHGSIFDFRPCRP